MFYVLISINVPLAQPDAIIIYYLPVCRHLKYTSDYRLPLPGQGCIFSISVFAISLSFFSQLQVECLRYAVDQSQQRGKMPGRLPIAVLRLFNILDTEEGRSLCTLYFVDVFS